MYGRDRDRLHQIAHDVKMLSRSLNGDWLDLPDFEPALGEARDCVSKLEGWVNEMDWISQEEMKP